MADSPSEKTEAAAKGSEPNKANTVPQERVDQLAAQKNEAKRAQQEAEAKAATLQKELAKAQEQVGGVDLAALAKLVAETVTMQTTALFDQRLKPLEQEVVQRRTQAQTGMNDEQFAAFAAVKQANPSLSDRQAMLLAQDEKPDLFGVSTKAFDPRTTGVLPPGGDSQYRQAPKDEDWAKKLAEAKTQPEAEDAAMRSLLQKVRRVRGQHAAMTHR